MEDRVKNGSWVEVMIDGRKEDKLLNIGYPSGFKLLLGD
jgi:hypothetical protein